LSWLTPIAASAVLCVVAIAPGSASADTGLSSTVIADALPGMVAAPPGPANGPLTSGELDAQFGHSGPIGDLSQAIADGQVNAYLRVWRSDPPNGAFVAVVAGQFQSAEDASAALAGATQAAQSDQLGHFSVPEIPHAVGVTMTMNGQDGILNEEMVQFAKGSILFAVTVGQVTTALNSGAPQLDEADVIQIARHQDAVAPGAPDAPCNCAVENTAYEVGHYFGLALMVGTPIGLAVLIVFFVRRRRAGSGAVAASALAWVPPVGAPYGNGAPPPPPLGFGSLAAGSVPSTAQTGTAVLEHPRTGRQPGFYCTWCGSHVSVGDATGHECGSRDRPATYCMRCGTVFTPGATACSGCGTPKLQ
jgi:hypothetical protein